MHGLYTDKENPGAHFNLANMLVDHYKDYTTAEYHFRKAIRLEPTYALYRMTYAEFLWHDCNRYQDSANQYEELIKYYSNNYDEKHQNEDIYFNYGLLLRDHLDDINKSIIQFRRVLEINAADTEAKEELNYTLSLLKTNLNNNKENDDGNVSSEPEPEPDSMENDEQREQPPSMKVSVTESMINEFKAEDMDLKNLLNGDHGDQDDEVVAELDANMTRTDYQKQRKKGSSFRRSQHEIVLPQLLADDDDSYALKYHQVCDEKNKLKVILKRKQLQQSAMNENLSKLKNLIKDAGNYGFNFRNEIIMMVQNGPNYVEANSKKAHKVLGICKDIVAQMLSVYNKLVVTH